MLNLPVISNIQERIPFLEWILWVALNKSHGGRRVRRVGTPIAENVGAVIRGKENIGRSLVGDVGAPFQLMLPLGIDEIVLQLVGVDDSALWHVRSWPIAQKVRVGESNRGDGVTNVVHQRNRTQRVAAELHRVARVTHTKFVEHSVVKSVRPANQAGLTERGNVHWIPRGIGGGARSNIEEVFSLI